MLPDRGVRPDDDLDAIARCCLPEDSDGESGLAYLEQIGTYGAGRRPSGVGMIWISYLAVCPELRAQCPGPYQTRTEIVPVEQVESGGVELEDRDRRIVLRAAETASRRLETTSLAASFCGPAFTISELRAIYEAIWGAEIDPGNFQRRVRANSAFLNLDLVAGEGPHQGVPGRAFDDRSKQRLAASAPQEAPTVQG